MNNPGINFINQIQVLRYIRMVGKEICAVRTNAEINVLTILKKDSEQA